MPEFDIGYTITLEGHQEIEADTIERAREIFDDFSLKDMVEGADEVIHYERHELPRIENVHIIINGLARKAVDVRTRKWVTGPESGHQQGYTSIAIEFDFEGKPVSLVDEYEDMRDEWADELTAWLKQLLLNASDPGNRKLNDD